VLLHIQTYAVAARAVGAQNNLERVAKLKTKAESLGMGKGVRIRMNATSPEMKGTITSLNDNGLTIADEGSGQLFSKTYAEIKSIEEDRKVGHQKRPEEPAKLRAKAESFGVGQKVKIRLIANSAEVKGTITSLDDTGVTIAEKASRQPLSKTYTQIKSINRDRVSAKEWGILATVATVGVIGFMLLAVCQNEGGC
jgi:hypothetical protein